MAQFRIQFDPAGEWRYEEDCYLLNPVSSALVYMNDIQIIHIRSIDELVALITMLQILKDKFDGC